MYICMYVCMYACTMYIHSCSVKCEIPPVACSAVASSEQNSILKYILPSLHGIARGITGSTVQSSKSKETDPYK